MHEEEVRGGGGKEGGSEVRYSHKRNEEKEKSGQGWATRPLTPSGDNQFSTAGKGFFTCEQG